MLKLIVAIVVFALASPAAAQAVQPWPGFLVTAPIQGKWIASIDVTGRAAADGRASQFESRVQIGRVITKRLTVLAGWVHSNNFIPGAPGTSEEQAAIQINWALRPTGRIRLLTRTRIEQRFVSGVADTSYRFREQVRAVVPLGGRTSPSFVLWGEPFLALNRTGAQHHDLDQLRTFAGFSVPLSPRADLEFGYLNQRVYRANDTLVNHAVPLILTYRF
jgi:hypothetical protein